MKKIGILGTSDIANRRFLPALKACNEFEFIGIASREKIRAFDFISIHGGKVFEDYDDLLKSNEIDSVYIPLPPSLHFYWAKKALENGKNVLLEKPFTTNLYDSIELIRIAKKNKLMIMENFAFLYHSQLEQINQIIRKNVLGEIRLYKISFGYPIRASNDFRFNRELGGGALFDAGVYPLKLSQYLLGENLKLLASNKFLKNDIVYYGSATLESESGLVSQISYGMDNSYKCELEVWGSDSTLIAERIFTAPTNLEVRLKIQGKNNETIYIAPEDQFLKMICRFSEYIDNYDSRKIVFKSILEQSKLLDTISNS